MSVRNVLVSVIVLLLMASSCWAVYCTTSAAVSTNGIVTNSDADQDWGYPSASCSSGANNGFGTSAGGSAWGYVSITGFDAKCSATTHVNRTVDDAAASAKASPLYMLAGGAMIAGPGEWVVAPVMPSAQLAVSGYGGSATLNFVFQVDSVSVLAGNISLNSYGDLIGSGIYDPVNFSTPMMDSEGNWTTEYIGPVEYGLNFQVDSFFDVFTELSVDITNPTGALNGGSCSQEIQWVMPQDCEFFVPEPSSFAGLLVPGALALLLRRRR
jgi:hypothetical protein